MYGHSRSAIRQTCGSKRSPVRRPRHRGRRVEREESTRHALIIWRYILEKLLLDARYSIRMLRKSPGFTLVAVIALALGIGANCAIFSVVNAVPLRPLPFKDPEGLVRIWGKFDKAGIPKNWISQPELLDLQEQNQTFESIAAYESGGVNLTTNANPVRVNSASVNASLFSVLGIQPTYGRTFLEEEDQPG